MKSSTDVKALKALRSSSSLLRGIRLLRLSSEQERSKNGSCRYQSVRADKSSYGAVVRLNLGEHLLNPPAFAVMHVPMFMISPHTALQHCVLSSLGLVTPVEEGSRLDGLVGGGL